MQAWAREFYLGKAWRACRRAYLAAKRWQCERCSTPDNPVPAKVVHHRQYITQDNINDPSVTLSWDNLQALCQDCHNEIHHARERGDRYSFGEDGAILPPSDTNFFTKNNRDTHNKKTPQARA